MRRSSRAKGKRVVGEGPVRTGVTAILPRGRASLQPVFAAFYAGNGNGDMTGTHWIEESGVLETPVMITNTLSVGTVRDAVIGWMVTKNAAGPFWYPVAAETSDGRLNDQKGQHVRAEHVIAGARLRSQRQISTKGTWAAAPECSATDSREAPARPRGC